MAIWHSHVGIVVNNLDLALPFWRDILGFQHRQSIERTPAPDESTGWALDGLQLRAEFLRHGNFQIELLDYLDRKTNILEIGAQDVYATHVAFFSNDIERHYQAIKARGIWFRSPPIQWNSESGSTYGKDPDGNWFQLECLPIASPGALPVDSDGFGHSHYGIVVNDLQKAMDFYCGLMGFVEVRESERLPPDKPQGNHMDGVHVRTKWIRLHQFQIELVDFVNLKNPHLDVGAMDVHATHVSFFTDNLAEDYGRLAAAGVWFRDEPFDYAGEPRRFVCGRDYDGHWFELQTPPDNGSWNLPQPAV